MTDIGLQLVKLNHLIVSGSLADLDVISASARTFAAAQVLAYGTAETGADVAIGLGLTHRGDHETAQSIHRVYVGMLSLDVPIELVVVLPKPPVEHADQDSAEAAQGNDEERQDEEQQ